MKVAVITPYHNEPLEWLEAAHQSVLAQTYPATHFMIADGNARPEIDGWENVQHIKLPIGHNDYGNFPRAVGSMSAINQGFDGVMYLDGDNWYYPNHVETLVTLQRESGAHLCSSNRMFHRLDGSPMGICPFSDGFQFFDVNCMFFSHDARGLVQEWYKMGPILAFLSDRYFAWLGRTRNIPRAFADVPTVAYRTSCFGDYGMFGEKAPDDPRIKDGKGFQTAMKWWREQGGPDVRMKAVRPSVRIPPPGEVPA